MLPPLLMVTIKNRARKKNIERARAEWCRFICLISLFSLLAGCTPAGPRALLEGKRLIERGKYSQAVEKLQTATSLLKTNAQAWNYLGLAYHHAGQGPDAEKAYERALVLNHDLTEVHYNLGCFWMEQNKPEAAKTEFTAYTLRRGDLVEGWLKLGASQLRCAELARAAPLRSHELGAAEKSFSEALRLSPQNPEALNGLGLARVYRGRAGEAAQFFESALKLQPNYPPALLNAAIVSHEYLKEHESALRKYHEYLALKPAPENAEAVRAAVRQLDQELHPPASPVATNAATASNANAITAKPVATNATRIAGAPKTETPPTNPARLSPATNVARPLPAVNVPKPAPAISPPRATNVELVRLPSEPVFKVGQDVVSAPTPTQAPIPDAPGAPSASATRSTDPKSADRGFLQRINPLNVFRSDGKSSALPARPASAESTVEEPTNSPEPIPTARYPYRSLPKPVAGNRAAAEGAFAEGVRAQQAHSLAAALTAYRSAILADPGYFDAWYNLGLAATEANDLPAALSAYEHALAIRPESLDGRCNFALVLKQANYLADAANELERVLAAYPNETRAHLALGNLYAQQLRQPSKARPHYVKVLETDPHHPQAGAVRYWLSDHPQ